MKPLPSSITRAVAAASVLGMLCFVSPIAADEPRPRRTPEEAAKEIEVIQQRVEALRKELEELEGRRKEREKPLPLAPPSVPKIQEARGFSLTIEADAFIYTPPRDSAYEAERHTAEKIKARVREADAKAKMLLEGGAPSHVLGR